MVADLKAGNVYVNVHVSTLRGEMRSQVRMVTSGTPFEAHLAGAHVVPPLPAPALGTGYFNLNAAETDLMYHITVEISALTGDITNAHIHRAPRGASGGVVVPLTFIGGTASGTWSGLTPQDVDDLMSGNLYVNIHTAAHGSGEIRGQIVMPMVPAAATGDVDYVSMTGGMVTIQPGDTKATVTVMVNGDDIHEADEVFTLMWYMATTTGNEPVAISRDITRINVVNDDPPPVISISNDTVSEDGGTANLTISISEPSGVDTMVWYKTVDATAESPADYTGATAKATIPAGETSAEIAVAIVDDPNQEPDETFTVMLYNAMNALISATNGVGTVTIEDNDFPGRPALFDPAKQLQVEGKGIRVAWVSEFPVDGYVEWAQDTTTLATNPTIATDVRGTVANRLNLRTHRVVINDLTPGPNQVIWFNIVNGGVRSGPFRAPASGDLPSNELPNTPDFLAGTVTLPGGAPGAECKVIIRVTERTTLTIGGQTIVFDQSSLWINDLTTDTGFYSVDITNIRQDPANDNNNNIDQAFAYDGNGEDTTITVSAYCDASTQGTTVKTTFDSEKGAAGFINHDVATSRENTAPEAIDDAATTLEDTPVTIPVEDNDIDIDPDVLTVVAITDPANGTATIGGSVTYTPDQDFFGVDTFEYTISDGETTSKATVTVTVTVVEVNDPPTANDDELTVEPDAPTTTLDVLANDTTSPDVDETLTITSIDTTNTTGTAAISGGGTGIDYTPPVGFKGTTTLEYTVGDGRGGQDAATVTIVVEKGTVTIAVPLGVGFNLIGVPVDFEQPLDFVGLAAQISAQADIDDNGDDIPDQIVSTILGWSAGSQVYRAFSPLNPGVNNDPLVKGQGYFVRLSKVPAGGFAWMATGRLVAAPSAAGL